VTHNQTNCPTDKDFDDTMRDLKSSLAHAIGRDLDAPAGSPPPRPVGPAATPGPAMWGPSSQRVTSPLALLATVADNARRLHQQLLTFADGLTGNPPPIRTREVHKLPSALLPAISALATEIDAVHSDIGQLLARLKEELL